MVIITIKSDGTAARNVREILGKHYDLEVKSRHTPDGKDLLVGLVHYPKGSVYAKKLRSEKQTEQSDNGRSKRLSVFIGEFDTDTDIYEYVLEYSVINTEDVIDLGVV